MPPRRQKKDKDDKASKKVKASIFGKPDAAKKSPIKKTPEPPPSRRASPTKRQKANKTSGSTVDNVDNVDIAGQPGQPDKTDETDKTDKTDKTRAGAAAEPPPKKKQRTSSAESAESAENAENADSADSVDTDKSADSADKADKADKADMADMADMADTADKAEAKKKALRELLWKHLIIGREEYSNRIRAEIRAGDQAANSRENAVWDAVDGARELGGIVDPAFQDLLLSVGVAEGGFQQRGCAVVDDRLLHQIRHLGWTCRQQVVVAEVEWMPAELAEAKRRKLVPQNFEPPEPLYKQCENDKTGKKPGTWYWEWNDPKYRMSDRRFVILDGFNRFTCINILLLEDPHYLDNRAIGCQLMKINVFDGLAIQLSTMKSTK
jgi:hypothetical protein